MNNKKVLVIGYFGTRNNQVDGQTIRTKSVFSLLKEKYDGEIIFFDTQTLSDHKFNYLKLLRLILKSDIVFNIAAQRNLKIFFPILFSITRLKEIELNYIAIGGWLFEFIKDKPIHKKMLSEIKNVFVQTENLRIELLNIGFDNVYLLNNFRLVDFPDIQIKDLPREHIKLVFMARVHPLKGIETIFKTEKELKTLGFENVSIDIYGPIFKDYENDFFKKIKFSSIRYCGIVEPSKVYETLQQYDLLLFPTEYYTEGFPGSILDAYISGIPVIASQWLNAKEFIEDGKTGYIVKFKDSDAFIKQLIEIIKSPSKLNYLQKNVTIKRNEYSANKAWETLKPHI